jgi:hypothetical protein
MSYLVPGAALRTLGVVLGISAVPQLARTRDSAASAPVCSIAPEAAGGIDEMPYTPAPEHEPSVLDLRVAAGREWRLETPHGIVHVWIPPSYDAATASTVVFVHGYHTDLETMWYGARLPQQFALSGVNAMFIAAEAPYAKLAPMVWPSLNALLQTVSTGTGQPLPKGRIAAIGHSGAYRTLVLWMANTSLETVVLLDAAYAELDRIAAWVRASRSHRLINIAYETQNFSDFMHRAIPGTLRVDGLPQSEFAPDAQAARALYVRTAVGHWPLVTDGVAIPLALRALGAPKLPDALDVPLGLD